MKGTTMRKRISDLASLVALGASGYALYRTWRVDARRGVALTLLVAALAVYAVCRKPEAPARDRSPGPDITLLTPRRIREDARREGIEKGWIRE
jgi:hypothetical protein